VVAALLLIGISRARLASFLLTMSERNGDGQHITLPMTRSDIADYLGLTIETVSRVFSQLRSQGVIQLKASTEVLVKSRHALEDLAEAA
jgi:CRP/FNR family nitrogen fixation transcriptional regulator